MRMLYIVQRYCRSAKLLPRFGLLRLLREPAATIRGCLAIWPRPTFRRRASQKAGEAFRKASRLDPRNGQHQLGIANSLAMQGIGRCRDAAQALRLVSAPGIDMVQPRQRASRSAQAGRSTPVLWKALDIDPASIDARISLGRVLHSQFSICRSRARASLRISRSHGAAVPHRGLARTRLWRRLAMNLMGETVQWSRDREALFPRISVPRSILRRPTCRFRQRR